MAQTLAPFILKDVIVTLQLVDDGTAIPPAAPIPGALTEFQCQLNRAELVPSTTGGTGEQTYETFCGPHSSGAGTSGSTWTLELSNFQSWADVEDLSNFLFDNEGAEAYYTLAPYGGAAPSATAPAFEGTVTLLATNVGGTAATYAVSTVSLPCKEKPTKVTV